MCHHHHRVSFGGTGRYSSVTSSFGRSRTRGIPSHLFPEEVHPSAATLQAASLDMPRRVSPVEEALSGTDLVTIRRHPSAPDDWFRADASLTVPDPLAADATVVNDPSRGLWQ